MSRNGNGKSLRFAALIRVSTEKQEKQGESLRLQRDDLTRDVRHLGGKIVEWYGGQEHGTPGWERRELDRLLSDAEASKWDAVIVAHTDRWSRDNRKSQDGIDVLKEHGKRFYVRTREYDLFDADDEFSLGIDALVNQRTARSYAKRSIIQKIDNAREFNSPSCGDKPYGRVWDSKKKTWSVDPEQQAKIEDIARRYVAGEKLESLGAEYGFSHPRIWRILTQRCGPIWPQRFTSKQFRIDETVETKIPALLPDELIEAVKRQLDANRTYRHGHSKHKYLLSRMIFCGHCGRALTGNLGGWGIRYYRHVSRKEDPETHGFVKVHNCLGGYVRADQIEDMVLRQLFETFGNPAAVQRAIDEATPNRDEVEESLKRRKRIEIELAKIDKGRQRVLALILKGTISEADAERQLNKAKRDEEKLSVQLARIDAALESVPSAEAVKAAAKQVSAKFRQYTDARLLAKIRHANAALLSLKLSWEDKRSLVQSVFAGKTAEGNRMGVYIYRGEQSKWRYTICGLIDAEGYFPMEQAMKDAAFVFGGPQRQNELVTKRQQSPPPTRRRSSGP